mgnify:CR=1 FL=1
MSIASEITRINTNIANAYTSLNAKGATIPQEQNSANLADTIDTISAGGGSSDLKMAAFEAIKAEITNPTILNKTKAQLEADGWSVYSDMSASILGNKSFIGYVFSEDMPDKIYAKYTSGFKVPSDVTITPIMSGNNVYSYEIDYSNSQVKWIVIPPSKDAVISASCGSINLSFRSAVAGTSYNATEAAYVLSFVEYFCYSLLDDQYTSSNRYEKDISSLSVGSNVDPFGLAKSYYLKDFYVTDNTKFIISLDGGNANQFPPFLVPVSRCVSSKKVLESFFPQYTYGQTSLSAAYTKMLMTNTSGYNYLARSRDFPFVLDCSTFTGSNTYYVSNGYTAPSDYDQRFSPPCSLYVILPSTGSFTWCTTYQKVIIPLECLEFMANHAPTVSGKTLKIGETNILRAGGSSGTIISTLTSKGWTVV